MGSLEENLKYLSTAFPVLMIAIIFHEFAHGYVARIWGDSTAEKAGRLTLNPLPHVDPMGTIFFPLILMASGVNVLFGWAKPVPIDPRKFKHYRKGLFWVSFAGPLMNFFLAFLSAIFLVAIHQFMSESFYLFEPLKLMAQTSVFLNYALGIFNLIPLPPLDGSKMIQSFLSMQATLRYESIARYSIFIFLALIFTGAFRILVYPVYFMSNLTISLVLFFFGVTS